MAPLQSDLSVHWSKRAGFSLDKACFCFRCVGVCGSSHPQILSSGASPSVNHADSMLPSVSPSHHPLAPNGVRRSDCNLTCLRLLWSGRRNHGEKTAMPRSEGHCTPWTHFSMTRAHNQRVRRGWDMKMWKRRPGSWSVFQMMCVIHCSSFTPLKNDLNFN